MQTLFERCQTGQNGENSSVRLPILYRRKHQINYHFGDTDKVYFRLYIEQIDVFAE